MVTVRTAKARYRIGVFKPSIPPPRRLDRVVVQIQRYWDRWSHTSSVLVCPHPFTKPSHTCLQKWGTGASNRAHRLRSGTEVDPLVRHRRSRQRLSTDVGSEHTFSRRSGTEEDLGKRLDQRERAGHRRSETGSSGTGVPRSRTGARVLKTELELQQRKRDRG
ncbi:hypothetical protein SUGI_1087190 [Cryptomeria japonica]|nr:hypothetical protein SUGI_1087190 [Cryptomeria japonica]